jgi:general stress protein 26
MEHDVRNDRAAAELQRLIDGISVAMVTTLADDDLFRSRPMLLERVEPDGSLVFLTHLSSHKAHELARDPRVGVTFVGDTGDRYVSIAGTGSITRDTQKVRELWNPTYRAWFPNGVDDADVGILCVQIDRVEYWDVSSSRLVRLWGVLRAVASGRPAEAGEHRTIEFGDPGGAGR